VNKYINLDAVNNHDSLRNKFRIEISAAIVVATDDKKLLKKHADIILKNQTNGYWLEYSYEKSEPAVGYYGAIPTSFCIIALTKAYAVLKEESYLHAAIKAADYLSDKETNGYFFKAGNNKSDVVNTNLMAGISLLKVSKILPKKSRRIHIYEAACVRTIRRALTSQHWNGAYPYTSFGITVPFLYHAMTLAQLTYLASDFNDSLLNYSIKKGLNYLKKITKNGKIDWNKRAENHLKKLEGKKFYFEGDFNKEEDPFYTAWCYIAYNHRRKIKIKSSFSGWLRFLFRVPMRKKLVLYCKILKRKLSGELDPGPVEYW